MSLAAAIAVAVSMALQAAPCAALRTYIRCASHVEVAGEELALFRPLASASMTAEELAIAGAAATDWLGYARQAAGTAVGDSRIFVDGVETPASAVTPRLVARVRVNTDPFAAEFTGVDQLRIDIDSRPPDRRWRFQTSLPSLVAGGRSPIGAAPAADVRSLSGGISGPVPRTPLTFSLDASDFFEEATPLVASALDGTLSALPDATTSTHVRSWLARTSWSAARAMINTSWYQMTSRAVNAGLGGIHVSPVADALNTSQLRGDTSWRIAAPTRVHRGAVGFTRERLDARASAPAPHVIVTGQLVRGAEILSQAQQSSRWHVKHVVESPLGRRPWTGGVEVQQSAVGDRRSWNASGRRQTATPGAVTATWTIAPSTSAARAAASHAAAFFEQRLVQRGATVLRAGGRADWQDGDGVAFSPRVSFATERSGFTISAGAGVFVQPWLPHLFATAGIRDTGFRLVRSAALDAPSGIGAPEAESLRSLIAPTFSRVRHAVGRVGVARRAGPVHLGVEQTWTIGVRLAGTTRRRVADGVADVLGSDRGLRRTQTHVRASGGWRGHSFTARYEHVRARDNTDGPFAFPAVQSDVEGEWAPSAIVPAHLASLMASLRLPHAWRVVITADARAGSRFNIITGADEEGLGTFTGRGGRPRNAGVLPASRTLSVYAMRPVRLKPVRNLPVNVGLRIDNVTNRTNVLSVGRVSGSPLYGVPLAAQPGRSIRVWATLAR